ncbi:MAG: lipopolysaccharide assembly protein LapA domain-containing protein [Actinomycetota bacterium]|nr:lipopolysaccharide assembly protein LapA domain-containing protein [Actinomycetota bacterium]
MGNGSEHEPSEPVPTGTGLSAGLIVGVLFGLAVIILAAQNTAHVGFRFLWWHARSPLVVIILGTGLAGVVLDEVVGLLWRRRRRHRLAERVVGRRIGRSSAGPSAT